MSLQPQNIKSKYCLSSSLYINVSVGWFRICSRSTFLKHSTFRSWSANHNRPILLWQKQMQESDICCGLIRNYIRKSARNLHSKASTFGLQRHFSMHGCHSERHRTKTTSREVPHVRSILLADFRRVALPYNTSDRLLERWKAIEQPTPILSRFMLSHIMKFYLVNSPVSSNPLGSELIVYILGVIACVMVLLWQYKKI